VLARSAGDVERFAALGIPRERMAVSGNIKYDLEPAEEPLPWHDQVVAAAAGRPIVVAGSTMDGEEQAVLEPIATLGTGSWQRLLLVLAPRHPERFETVAELLAARGIRFLRRSDTAGLEALGRAQDPIGCDVLLLDTIGELSRAYQLARLAFIGGSLVPTGGHNPLEPAVWGVPVLSGPHVENFHEIYDELIEAGGARLVGTVAELAHELETWLTQPEAARAAGQASLAVVEQNRGATRRTAEALLQLVGVSSGPP